MDGSMATGLPGSITPLDGADQRVAEEIARLGFSWTYDPQYDLTQLDLEKRRVQIREEAHYAPLEAIERYSVQMTQSKFPAIVVTQDKYLIDGTTRAGAARKANRRHFPAIIVDIEYNGRKTTAGQRRALAALGTTLNAMNGTPLTPRELRAQARTLIEMDWKSDEIARAIGIKSSMISGIRREMEAEKRLGALGISKDDLKGTSLRALGGSIPMGLNLEPYRNLATLAAEAGFNASEITNAAKDLKETGSDDAALGMLKQMREVNRQRINTRHLTGTGKPPISRQLCQRLGFALKFEGHPEELLESDRNLHEHYIDTLTRSVALLNEVIELQQS